ncbi:hypothetical protein E8A66_08410 [Vibrio cholerae]|uniref:hypothetical protein n=1 Tax=Vibrio cholerae TaxID=666 RepID=UPI0011583B2C|nr:hypothetical protein [Vibrio cholerae]EGR0541486.1 hypothetical protein [Vibrio cholerae]EGR1128571.1 hypothetical protein [Vibrio cholerae]QYO72178.1 hypothetical protein KTC41_14800 [Vibrio cholerae]TQQ40174.1 hypothetical protein FLL64_14700 [Vibrio cholerae]GIA38769.1 hypothetical protein VCSRO38_2763 [Vibrio cholerae]
MGEKGKGQQTLTLSFVALFLIFVNNPSHELSVNKQKLRRVLGELSLVFDYSIISLGVRLNFC